jgi:hypothetical protein
MSLTVVSFKSIVPAIQQHPGDFMKHVMALFCGLVLSATASAQGFFNLDFEKGKVVSKDPTFGFLDWNVAVPGWSHSDGSDTQIVYRGSPHIGISQYYLLVDSALGPFSLQPIEGRFSLFLHSGRASSLDLSSPWVNAFIAQTGLIPANAQSLRLKAAGSIDVYIGGQRVDLQPLGGNGWGANIPDLAGQLKELRVVNAGSADSFSGGLLIDSIRFSTVPVPEPSIAAGILLGLGVLTCFRRRFHSSPDIQKNGGVFDHTPH